MPHPRAVQLRLVSGRAQFGRLEVFTSKQWGSVSGRAAMHRAGVVWPAVQLPLCMHFVGCFPAMVQVQPHPACWYLPPSSATSSAFLLLPQVCDQSFSRHAAEVVCRNLNMGLPAISVSGAFFGQSSGPVHFDAVTCEGTEDRLEQCSRTPGGAASRCTHAQDVSVACNAAGEQGGLFRRVAGFSSHQSEGRQ